MIVNLLKNNWKIVAIAILFVIIGVLSKIYMSEAEGRRVAEANVVQLTMDYKSQVLRIKDEEQKKHLIAQDSLTVAIIDSLNLRPAKIERIFNTKYIYIHDTVEVELTPNVIDTAYKNFNHVFDPCASIKGRVNWNDNILLFDEFKNDINITTVYYWDRKHRFLWILSKKKHFAITTNNCTGESVSKEIIFEK